MAPIFYRIERIHFWESINFWLAKRCVRTKSSPLFFQSHSWASGCCCVGSSLLAHSPSWPLQRLSVLSVTTVNCPILLNCSAHIPQTGILPEYHLCHAVSQVTSYLRMGGPTTSGLRRLPFLEVEAADDTVPEKGHEQVASWRCLASKSSDGHREVSSGLCLYWSGHLWNLIFHVWYQDQEGADKRWCSLKVFSYLLRQKLEANYEGGWGMETDVGALTLALSPG